MSALQFQARDVPSPRPLPGMRGAASWAAEEAPPLEDSRALIQWAHQERRPRLIATRGGEVLWMNAAVRALVASEGPITVKQGWLTGATQQVSERLQILLSAPRPSAPCWLLEEDGVLVWAEHIARPAPATVGLTIRRVGDEVGASALTAARNLTPAQARIMDMMLNGVEAARIAQELDISIETLRTHVKHLYTKLGVNSRGAMFALAFRFVPP